MGNKITRRRLPAIDDRHTRPQGLYPCKGVDQQKLRRLILDSKLAPCYPGGEEPVAELEECPICFLNYPSLNRSKCCTKGICTECFLQVKSPSISQPTQCPYCKMANYSVEYRGPKSMEEKGLEQAEEQKVIEAKIRMRQQELQDDEEREQRRNNDVRDNHPPPHPAILPPDSDWDDWQAACETISHPSQDPLSSGLPERAVVEPDSLWVQGSHQFAANDEGGAPQQALPALTPQQAMPALRHHGIDSFRTVQRLGAQLTRGAARSGFYRHNRDDEFDLDLEDIMVMEAIWISLQEQGAQHGYPGGELHRAVQPVNLSTSRTGFGLGSEVDTDSGALMLPPQQLPPLLPLPPLPSVLDIQHQAPPGRHSSVTGGLAGAIAALAEQQVVGGNTTSAAQQSIVNTLPPEPALVNGRAVVSGTNQQHEILHGEEALETAFQA
ncbi:hypothetical protein BDL97_12G090900 [Sphagnum fallax]|nr:hypothetical protein BDL97_12G090900 [Sphagnum fallax]